MVNEKAQRYAVYNRIKAEKLVSNRPFIQTLDAGSLSE